MPERKIIRNAARCRKCDDVAESRSRHDFRACQCRAMYVDGGLTYLKRGGNPADIEELAEYAD